MIVLLLVFFIITPLFIEYLSARYNFLNKVGTVLISYAVGLLFAQFIDHSEDLKTIQTAVSSAAIMLALPILLMDLRLKSLRAIAGKTAISSLIALVAVSLVVVLTHQFFKDRVENSWQISGMMIGIYTGGTVNLASIQKALGVPQDTYIAVHTFDTLWTTLYLLGLLIMSGQFSFKKKGVVTKDWKPTKRLFEALFWLKKTALKNTLIQVGLAIIVAGLSVGVGYLFKAEIRDAAIMLAVTTIGVVGAIFVSKSDLKISTGPGNYFLNMFGLALASMADFRNILHSDADLILWIAAVLFGSFILHWGFSKIFKVDNPTTMVVSVAFICSPPFVPVISKSYNRNDLLLPGLVVGVLGYVIGNYLGVIIAYILK